MYNCDMPRDNAKRAFLLAISKGARVTSPKLVTHALARKGKNLAPPIFGSGFLVLAVAGFKLDFGFATTATSTPIVFN